VDNTYQLDCYGPFLGAFGTSLKWQWQRSVINPGKNPRIPRTGGIAFADRSVTAEGEPLDRQIRLATAMRRRPFTHQAVLQCPTAVRCAGRAEGIR
jgi:hypothetical protein